MYSGWLAHSACAESKCCFLYSFASLVFPPSPSPTLANLVNMGITQKRVCLEKQARVRALLLAYTRSQAAQAAEQPASYILENNHKDETRFGADYPTSVKLQGSSTFL